jgi:uncharacterized membrane protein
MGKLQFINHEEELLIIKAIENAENETSGEIRVHIENHTELKPLERAQEVFFQLEMDKTVLKNGVLFYVGVSDHSFAIIGDEGINKVVEDDFWECTKDVVIEHFKKGEFQKGLSNGITRAGERLKEFFPKENENPNELTNEISRA